jgi:DNA-directed RNA polymerase alpha subunit
MPTNPSEATHPNAAAFPAIGGSALRALARAGVRSLDDLTERSERELLQMHGLGPKAVRLLQDALSRERRSLRTD